MALSDDDIEKHFRTAVETLRSDTHSAHLRELLARTPAPSTEGDKTGTADEEEKPPAPPKKDVKAEPGGESPKRTHFLFKNLDGDDLA